MKNYIWDFDGMLFDSYPHITKSFQLAMEDSGRSIDFAEAKALFEVSFHTAYEFYGVTDEIIGRHHFYDRQYELEPVVIPFENTHKALEKLFLDGKKNYLYTHRGHTTSQYYLEKYDMLKFFSDFVDSDMKFPPKPAPDAIEYICREYSLEKSESVMTGDREIDVMAGINAGISGCLFTKEKNPVTQADFIIRDIIEILDI